MRIAYVSYEHPAGIAGGGIGTYMGQIAKMMAENNNEVEVFTGTKGESKTISYNGYIVHLIPSFNNNEFRKNLVTPFKNRHDKVKFEIVESPEYGADALNIKNLFPNLPLTVKLHTPSFLTTRLNANEINVLRKLRFIAGGLVRGKLVKPYWIYRKNIDPEFNIYKLADSVSSPSKSLRRIIIDEWGNKEIEVLPYVFTPSQTIMNLPVAKVDKKKIIITFIGRLEKRKGVLDLLKAIPNILSNYSNVFFRFIGKPHPSPEAGMDMVEYMKFKLEGYLKNVEFLGSQPYEKIPFFLQESHICIFPSIWENFPNVCLEAMAAGRAVIGTNNGGMADMITHNLHGILIKPNDPMDIVSAISALCNEPEKIERLGQAARKRVIYEYNTEKIGSLVESLYRKTIANSAKDVKHS